MNRVVFSLVYVVVRHFKEVYAGLNKIRENPCCQNVVTGYFSVTEVEFFSRRLAGVKARSEAQ